MIDYDELDRDQLLLREAVLREGIKYLKVRTRTTVPQPNREWLERETTSLEAEIAELRSIRERKFHEDVSLAQMALADGPEAIAVFLGAR